MEEDNSLLSKIFSKSSTPYWIVIIFGFILYFQTLFFNFSYLDDNALILGNANFLSSFSNVIHAFGNDVFISAPGLGSYYRPILTLSFIFDYHIGSITPFIYHFTNMLLHLLASCLVFNFFKKLDYKKELAFLFSVFFLISPVLVQAVAWIPGRNDSLLTIFVLLTFIYLINYFQKKSTRNLFWSLLFFALAIFTKESALFILPILLIYLYYIAKIKNRKENKMILLYYFIGTIIIVGLWFMMRHIALFGATAVPLINIFKSVYFSLPAVLQLVGKIFFPFNLSVFPIMQDTTFVYGIISVILLAAVFFFTKIKRYPYILFGVLWFFAFLLPSFIRPDLSSVANFSEHRLYLPIIGLFIVLLETDLIKNINFKKKNTLMIIGGVILFLSIITIIHTTKYVNRISFWKNAALNSPHYSFAHKNLGAMYYLDGNINNAEIEYKKALELNYYEPMVHSNLALVYVNQNKLKEAEEEYKKEIEINPYYDNVYFNLGLLYFSEGRGNEAVISWKKTLSINPNYIDALKALTSFYYNQKNFKESLIYATKLESMGFTLPSEMQKTLQLNSL